MSAEEKKNPLLIKSSSAIRIRIAKNSKLSILDINSFLKIFHTNEKSIIFITNVNE